MRISHSSSRVLLTGLTVIAVPIFSGWSQQFTSSTGVNRNLLGEPRKQDRAYILKANDLVQVSVYQEEDMGVTARLEKDGTILMPLLGKVQIGGRTLEGASQVIRDLLAREFLVNPQVTLTIVEFAKRRFTVLGQVQRPGTYELPTNEPLDLLQAIAVAGGYTRIGAPSKVTVLRAVGDETRTLKLDAQAMSKDPKSKPFQIEPGDTITVGERLI